jgi:hypothetical protein
MERSAWCIMMMLCKQEVPWQEICSTVCLAAAVGAAGHLKCSSSSTFCWASMRMLANLQQEQQSPDFAMLATAWWVDSAGTD